MDEAPVNKPNRGAARRRLLVVLATGVAGSAVLAGGASAQISGGGGTTAPTQPQISSIQCLTRCIGPDKGVAKSKIRIAGTDLNAVRSVSLPRADGRWAKDKRPIVKPNGAVVSKVVKGAVTGPVRVTDSFGTTVESGVSFNVGTMEELKEVQAQYTFPVKGSHTYGDGFGAARDGHSHQGQDIFAACGTPLVAIHTGTVKAKAFQGSAGNYVVIDAQGVKQDYFYAHLKAPATVSEGQKVTTGQRLGKVGESGNAQGCHLHFEIWTGGGWYTGGKPVDPLKLLKYWDSFS